eukprot:m.20511 g.20511  ORF g.20511 m.20511 type:complete len:1102 (+) comp28021_c0_seq1:59-3364(+)
MEKPNSVVAAAESGDLDWFLRSFRTKKDSSRFDALDFVQHLSKRQTHRLWDGILHLVKERLDPPPFIAPEAENDDTKQDEKALQLISVTTRLAQATLQLEEPEICPSLLEVAKILNGLLLEMPDGAQNEMEAMADLFVLWWTGDHVGKNELMALAVPCLIARALAPGAAVERIGVLNEMSEAFFLFNYNDDSIEDFEKLLFQCLITRLFLTTTKGRQFLAFLFHLDITLVPKLHARVKENISVCTKESVEAYGDIYLRAWRDSVGPIRQVIEDDGIGDFASFIFLANRETSFSLFSRLHHFMGQFHANKDVSSVQDLLHRLYSPHMWRFMKSPNNCVRANAATLFIDCFPLISYSDLDADTDTLIQRSVETLNELLDDPYPVVRSIGVAGVCRVADFYWKLLPYRATKHLVTRVIKHCAFDCSSSDVRVAVLKGLSDLAKNSLSQDLLKELLPQLKNHIHDRSERVRIFFVKFLIVIKSLPFMKYWHVAPFDHILYHLETDTEAVANAIVDLLYFSAIKSNAEEVIDRCVNLMKKNREAGRRFYKIAFSRMTEPSKMEFAELLILCMLSLAGQPDKAHGMGMRKDPDKVTDGDATCLLEVMVIACDSMKKPVKKRKFLALLCQAIPVFLETFQSSEDKEAILLTASCLPAGSVVAEMDCLKILRGTLSSTPIGEYGPLLICLCQWKQGRRVLDLIQDWLGMEAKESSCNNQVEKKRRRKKPGRKVASEGKNYPRIALNFLDHIVKTEKIMEALSEETDALENVAEVLKPLIGRCVSDVDISTDALKLLIRLRVALLLLKQDDKEPMCELRELVDWTWSKLRPALQRGQNEARIEKEHGENLLKIVFEGCVNVIALGLDTPEFRQTLVHFAVSSSAQFALPMVPSCCKLLYQLSQILLRPDEEPDTASIHQLTILTEHMLSVISREICKEPTVVSKLSDFRHALIESLKPVYRYCLLHRHAPDPSSISESTPLEATPMHHLVCHLLKCVSDALPEEMDEDPCKDISSLSPAAGFLLEAVSRSDMLKEDFLVKLNGCAASGALTGDQQVLSLLAVMSALIHSGWQCELLATALAAVERWLKQGSGVFTKKEHMLGLIDKIQAI